MTGNGLSVTYKFTRTISIYSPKMASIELTFNNNTDKTLNAIKIGDKVKDLGIHLLHPIV